MSWGTMSLRLNECVAPFHGCMGSNPRIALLAGSHPSCKKSDALLRELRRKYFLRGGIVLSYCVLPPVHIGQDLVYSGITKTLETVPFQPYFGCTESFLKVLSN